jgi:hypothetical protein
MHKACPLAIRLAVTDGLTLRAFLVNNAAQPLMVLHDQDLQASAPILTRSGADVPFFDTRSIRKFDTTPYRDLYKILEPAQELLLETARFTWADDGYSLQWGPYEGHGIAPGTYHASIRWRSTLTRWVDRETGETGTWTNTWLGELTSAEVRIELTRRNTER